MIIKTLYARNITGSIQTWSIDLDGDKYRTISGQLNSPNMVTTNWTYCESKNIGKKNETNSFDQASKEVAALIKKKIKEGYKEDIKDIDEVTFFQPQLAKSYEDYKDDLNWEEGVWVSPKLDGLRLILSKDGAFTRNGREFVSVPHIVDSLKPVFEQCPDLILDGECYCDRLSNDFNKIISLAKKTKPTQEDLAESEKYLEYHIFDIPSFDSKFKDRWELIKEQFKVLSEKSKYVRLVPHIYINKESDIEKHLHEFIGQGYEGLMINLNDYYQSKRTKSLLKYKLFKDEEFKILDILEGEGNRGGMFGRALLEIKNGATFESNARGTQEFYIELFNNKENYIGKLATVRYQNLTPDGIPRFPVIVGIRDFE